MNTEITGMDEILTNLKTTKFPKSGKALSIYIIKIHYLSSSIIKCCEVDDYYSSAVLFRSLLEHYFRHLYIYTRALKEKEDAVGEEYYGKLNGYEDFTFIISMQNLSKKLKPEENFSIVGDAGNEGLKEVGRKFEIKSILDFLNKGIENNDIKPTFEEFFTGYCKKYYDLSSFVHGGPFAEKFMEMYSNNPAGMNNDLEYFSKESALLLNRVVQNTKIFLEITQKDTI